MAADEYLDGIEVLDELLAVSADHSEVLIFLRWFLFGHKASPAELAGCSLVASPWGVVGDAGAVWGRAEFGEDGAVPVLFVGALREDAVRGGEFPASGFEEVLDAGGDRLKLSRDRLGVLFVHSNLPWRE